MKVSRKEQHSVVRFLWPKGVSANAIYTVINPMYGDKCFMRTAIHVWCKKFVHRRENVDEQRPAHAASIVYSSSIHKLVVMWDKCLNECGRYV